MLERAERSPRVETFVAIAKALGVTVSQLFLGLGARRADHELPLIDRLRAFATSIDPSEGGSLGDSGW
jgi:transcriptional regulator with XRE-family HTH domain